MIFTNVENMIKNRTIESLRIEYKMGLNPDKLVQTICAFANDIERKKIHPN